MVSELLTLVKKDSVYKALKEDGLLYRMEDSQLAEWMLYGGAIPDVDFEYLTRLADDESIFNRADTDLIGGLGKYTGKALKNIARFPIQLGYCLIVTPINSPRAKTLKISDGKTAVLSGIVKEIKIFKRVEDISKLLQEST